MDALLSSQIPLQSPMHPFKRRRTAKTSARRLDGRSGTSSNVRKNSRSLSLVNSSVGCLTPRPCHSDYSSAGSMSRRGSLTPGTAGPSSRSVSRTNAIKLKPLSTIEEHDLYLHADLCDKFLQWRADWTLLFDAACVTRANAAGSEPAMLFNRYTEMSAIDKRKPVDRIRWRFYTMFFYDLHLLLNEHDNLTARGFETLFAALNLDESSEQQADEVKRNLRSWIARGHRYRNLSKALGGSGILFLLPEKITEYLWEESLPLKGEAFEQAAQLLANLGITEKASELGAIELGSSIESGLLDPFRWSTHLSSSGLHPGRSSRLRSVDRESRSRSRSRSSLARSISGSTTVFSTAPSPSLSTHSVPVHSQRPRQPRAVPRHASLSSSHIQPSFQSSLPTSVGSDPWSNPSFFNDAGLPQTFGATVAGISQAQRGRGARQHLSPGEMTPYMSSAQAQPFQGMQTMPHLGSVPSQMYNAVFDPSPMLPMQFQDPSFPELQGQDLYQTFSHDAGVDMYLTEQAGLLGDAGYTFGVPAQSHAEIPDSGAVFHGSTQQRGQSRQQGQSQRRRRGGSGGTGVEAYQEQEQWHQ